MDKLNQKQIEWLRKMRDSHLGSVSVMTDRPPTSLMRKLEKAGLCKDVMSTFWKITEHGQKKINEIDGVNHG